MNKIFLDFKLIFAFVLITISLPICWAQQQSSFWTGNGGKGIRITVAEPSGKGLSTEEQSLLPLIQSTIIGSFQKFSAMTIFDRQNLENILREQRMSLSGNFSDSDFIRIGHLTNANFIVFGSINKISSNYFMEFAVSDVETGERKASYPPKQVSLLALQDFSAAKDASADLLSQLGVNLTDRAIQELIRAENTTRIQAENLLSRGITAQRQGSVADAFSYYFQAAALEPSLIEAVSRASLVSANISGGNIGQDVRNRLKVHDEWRIVINAARTFYSSHLPYEFVYDTNINRGTINFDRRTTNLSIGLSLIPTDAWNTISDLRQGLSKARQPNESWNFNLNQIEPRQIVVILEILNQNNLILSRGTHTFSNPYNSTRLNATLNFQNVKADDLTDRLTVRVVSINDIPAQRAAETGFIQITTLATYNRRQEQIKAAEEATKAEADRARREHEEATRREREAREKERQTKIVQEREIRMAPNRRNLWEAFSLSFQWDEDDMMFLFSLFISGFYWSPTPYTYIGLETRFGFGGELAYRGGIDSKGNPQKDFEAYYLSIAPALGLIFPINKSVAVFTDAILEIGSFGFWSGIIANGVTPGFNIGLRIGPFVDAGGLSINLKYRGLWLENKYTHSIGIGLGGVE